MTTRDTYDILAYEEEQKQTQTGINIQINTLVDAMIDAEKCLFHNSDSNLMPVNDQSLKAFPIKTIVTLETLAEQAGARGAILGAQDALGGVFMNEQDAPKYMSDINLLYMVFVYKEGDDEEIYTDYIRSEFLLAYTFAFAQHLRG